MPRIKKSTDANGTVFYPISISKAVYDTDRNKRLSATLDDFASDISSKVDTTTLNTILNSMSIDDSTGEFYLEYENS